MAEHFPLDDHGAENQHSHQRVKWTAETTVKRLHHLGAELPICRMLTVGYGSGSASMSVLSETTAQQIVRMNRAITTQI